MPRLALGILALLPLAACRGPCGTPCPDACPAPSSAARTDPTAAADADALEAALTSLDATPQTRERAIDLGRTLWEAGRLRAALETLGKRFLAGRPALAKRVDDSDRVTAFVGAQLWIEGRNPRHPSAAQPSWEALARSHAAMLAASAVPRSERSLENPAFVAELEALGGAPFTDGNSVEVLVDGPASWAVREPLVASARRELLVASWAIYDDGTGRRAVDAFLARAGAGVDVRVVVDGQTESLPAYAGQVERLATGAAGLAPRLAVTRWLDAARPFDGMHQKLLIVDADSLVTGGMNWGDAYSHADPASPKHWRDTDVLVRGPAVAQARALFARRYGAPLAAASVAVPVAVPRNGATERVALLEHVPGDDDPILRTLLKALDGARTSIDVENAYVVRIPSVEAGLLDAVRRGVRVRVLTNSATSCDEPIIAGAILRSVGALADGGVEVYLRRGTTLHGKFATVDGVFAQVGSYNLHPRSHRLEHEVVVDVLGRRTAERLEETFEADLREADRIRSSADVAVPDDPLGRIAWLLCPDLL